MIAAGPFAAFIRERFAATGRGIEDSVVERVLATTGGHPYATQELCYALWDRVADGETAADGRFEEALDGVLRSENAHFSRIWDRASRRQRLTLQALAQEPLTPISSSEFRRRYGLGTGSTVYRALDRLAADELVAKAGPGLYRLAEPFLAEWILRKGV